MAKLSTRPGAPCLDFQTWDITKPNLGYLWHFMVYIKGRKPQPSIRPSLFVLRANPPERRPSQAERRDQRNDPQRDHAIQAPHHENVSLDMRKIQRDSQPDQRPHKSQDRKSTRLNSSHANISYAVFCL